MKNIKYLFLFVASVFLLNSCETGMPETTDLNYVTFEATSMDLGVSIDGSTDYELAVYTTQTTGTDRTFDITVDLESTNADAQAYSVPATVTVPANSNTGTFVLGLNDVNIGDGVDIVLNLEVDPGVYKGDAMVLSITQLCEQNDLSVKLSFGDWASECSWTITDASETVVLAGSGYSDGDAEASAKACLPDGAYTFTVVDAYGDGIGGEIIIINNGAEVVNIPGDYGAGTSADFTLP
ncbi:hypothetical protein [Draconibacterium halophilum]|uniref:Uncharacterized protein n=1 Tax=Draconibacterium halophilum TaxID=2706887 RepID=A0A6C0RC98_9BACT|nr:hypothetical protein [Draconibacterium halophilum]QIA08278.1 hypothetical protein G0Q07_11375 [Draconibacterium halophilum]